MTPDYKANPDSNMNREESGASDSKKPPGEQWKHYQEGLSAGVRGTIVLLAGFIVTAALLSVVLWLTILPGFKKLEAGEARQNMERAINSLASIGVSLFPHDGEDASQLVKRADTAMYISKQNGGARYTFYEQGK